MWCIYLRVSIILLPSLFLFGCELDGLANPLSAFLLSFYSVIFVFESVPGWFSGAFRACPSLDEYKFLRKFDEKLTFISYLKYLKNKCTKTLRPQRIKGSFLEELFNTLWSVYIYLLIMYMFFFPKIFFFNNNNKKNSFFLSRQIYLLLIWKVSSLILLFRQTS